MLKVISFRHNFENSVQEWPNLLVDWQVGNEVTYDHIIMSSYKQTALGVLCYRLHYRLKNDDSHYTYQIGLKTHDEFDFLPESICGFSLRTLKFDVKASADHYIWGKVVSNNGNYLDSCMKDARIIKTCIDMYLINAFEINAKQACLDRDNEAFDEYTASLVLAHTINPNTDLLFSGDVSLCQRLKLIIEDLDSDGYIRHAVVAAKHLSEIQRDLFFKLIWTDAPIIAYPKGRGDVSEEERLQCQANVELALWDAGIIFSSMSSRMLGSIAKHREGGLLAMLASTGDGELKSVVKKTILTMLSDSAKT